MNNTTKILLVEDEKALADVLEAKLKKEGYEVMVSYDGEDGFRQIVSWQPDLILLDIVMPKMDGYEVLEKMNESNIHTPVIIISNSGQPVEIEKTMKLGAVDYLIKAEFRPNEVMDKIRNFLQGHGAETAKSKEGISPITGNCAVAPLGIKVVLVEDESFLREICGKKLVSEGFEVYAAVDGEQALEIISQVKPDIVLLDIILPAIDGFEVLSRIRSNEDSAIRGIPVIMLSNLGQEDDINKAMEMGATGYLVKAHFTTDEIVSKIKEVLKR